jgi:hypothetical protein
LVTNEVVIKCLFRSLYRSNKPPLAT